jgi:hypothetical protein
MARSPGEPIPAADATAVRKGPRTAKEKMYTFAQLLGISGIDGMDEAALDKAIRAHLAGNPANLSPSTGE